MKDKKKLVPCIFLQRENALELAKYYSDAGADELLVLDLSDSAQDHEKAIGLLRQVVRTVEIPVIAGGNVKRAEDIKKLLYAGAEKAILNLKKADNQALTEEVSKRFGKEKIAVSADNLAVIADNKAIIEEFAGELIYFHQGKPEELQELSQNLSTPVLSVWKEQKADICQILSIKNVRGISTLDLSQKDTDFAGIKKKCKAEGIAVEILESSMEWAEFKLNSDGMIPVVVQDYMTNEVLMLAYMNEEAYKLTIATGRMTYFSRSRNEIWVKGLTSGHFQYVKSLTMDCDLDTLLAKVSQVGAACHTGSYSCFFNHLTEKAATAKNPMGVLNQVYSVIADRKEHPKEGSYTNYLFQQGMDKILKKVGEEATEIVIAAKNTDSEEIKYEISDFLYHVMVLMVEKGVSWEDITKELANR
ncbi:MAG: bifunctional phosphoribosyl-AMP cyclohydrolase/phosphoribosyl-ATP diphosphatase HisIE [Lachnospiraceae bacterium]|nr:bifunctional phosphoribosyl-AMP cyclohydrolase/phosphoribosyl-ATP diphosphatase HisIE [Lachnospiraceae bacterium]